MEDLNRRPGETAIGYHKRLIDGKLVDKTLADADYSELAEYIYGKQYASDVARRMMYGSKKTLELLEREDEESLRSSTPSETLREIEQKKADLQKERQRFFDQRREYNKLVNADGRWENLHAAIKRAAAALPETVGVFDNHEYTWAWEDGAVWNEAVLVLCDWHYGMTTNNIANTYNTAICEGRVEAVVEAAIDRLNLHSVKRLHVVLLGDFVHGGIHVSARVAAEELVCDQLIQVSEIIARAIYKLSKYVPEVLVHHTYGNHGRVTPNKKESVHRDNFERLIGWWLEERFANNDSVKILPESETEFITFQACGHWICATHGDLDSVNQSPRLLSSLFRKQYGVDIECVLLADKHHRESFEELGVTAMISGALCGTDNYASEKRLFSTPSQLLLIFNSIGGLDAEYRLNCDKESFGLPGQSDSCRLFPA